MLTKLKTFNNKIFTAVKHLLKRLISSPLLLGWIIIGTIIEIILNGFPGFVHTCVNLILLGVFATIIKIMSEGSAKMPIQKLKAPKFELALGTVFFIYMFTTIAVYWEQIKIPYFSSGVFNLLKLLEREIFKLGAIGIPKWTLKMLANASFTIIFHLIPIIILFLCCGYGFKKMGFVFNNFKLILVLLGITIALGLPSKVLFQHSAYRTIFTFLIMMFINALPEELIFSGYLLPRLEAVLKNPINALVIVAILFNIAHIPTRLAHGMSFNSALLTSFSIGYPTGLIWGYLYLKTRSVVPGIIWHTSYTILGTIFL